MIIFLNFSLRYVIIKAHMEVLKMTFIESEKFYNQDKLEYQIDRNKDFLYWLKGSIKNGIASI